MNINKLEKLRKKLPPNYIKTLMDRTGLSRSSITLTLYGKRENIEVIEAAIALAKKHEERLITINNQINDIL
jgi:hypothetical protein